MGHALLVADRDPLSVAWQRVWALVSKLLLTMILAWPALPRITRAFSPDGWLSSSKKHAHTHTYTRWSIMSQQHQTFHQISRHWITVSLSISRVPGNTN